VSDGVQLMGEQARDAQVVERCGHAA
jgi:hypothetical protein